MPKNDKKKRLTRRQLKQMAIDEQAEVQKPEESVELTNTENQTRTDTTDENSNEHH